MSARARPAAAVRDRDASRLPRLGVGVALGLPAGVAAVLVTWLLDGDPRLGLLLVTVAAVAVGARTSPPSAAAAAAVCWACYDGFVVHNLGELHLDLLGLSAVTVAAIATSAARTMAVRRAANPVVRVQV